MGANGALTNVTNVSDNTTLLLDRVIGVTTVMMNGQTYVIAASNNDSGVSVFKLIDDSNHAPTLTATATIRPSRKAARRPTSSARRRPRPATRARPSRR